MLNQGAEIGLDENAGQIDPGPPRSVPTRICAQCEAALKRRQKRFCSAAHRKLWWEARHPRLPDKPRSQDAGPLIPRIRELFADGCWRTDREAAAALGVLEGSLAARRRETGWSGECYCVGGPSDPDAFRHFAACQQPKWGWTWETRRRAGSKEREHRLVKS